MKYSKKQKLNHNLNNSQQTAVLINQKKFFSKTELCQPFKIKERNSPNGRSFQRKKTVNFFRTFSTSKQNLGKLGVETKIQTIKSPVRTTGFIDLAGLNRTPLLLFSKRAINGKDRTDNIDLGGSSKQKARAIKNFSRLEFKKYRLTFFGQKLLNVLTKHGKLQMATKQILETFYLLRKSFLMKSWKNFYSHSSRKKRTPLQKKISLDKQKLSVFINRVFRTNLNDRVVNFGSKNNKSLRSIADKNQCLRQKHHKLFYQGLVFDQQFTRDRLKTIASKKQALIGTLFKKNILKMNQKRIEDVNLSVLQTKRSRTVDTKRYLMFFKTKPLKISLIKQYKLS